MPTPIYYNFQQRFNVPAHKAFEWCTTYTPEDHVLMGAKGVIRKIEHITDRTVILTDTFNTGAVNQFEKPKLVQIYPETLFWTSTHISGPAKHSQFIYQITAESHNISNLDFTGLFIDYGDKKRVNQTSKNWPRRSAKRMQLLGCFCRKPWNKNFVRSNLKKSLRTYFPGIRRT